MPVRREPAFTRVPGQIPGHSKPPSMTALPSPLYVLDRAQMASPLLHGISGGRRVSAQPSAGHAWPPSRSISEGQLLKPWVLDTAGSPLDSLARWDQEPLPQTSCLQSST